MGHVVYASSYLEQKACRSPCKGPSFKSARTFADRLIHLTYVVLLNFISMVGKLEFFLEKITFTVLTSLSICALRRQRNEVYRYTQELTDPCRLLIATVTIPAKMCTLLQY